MFSPACCRPVKYSAIFRPAPVETIPLVNTPVRSSERFARQPQHAHAGVIVVDHLTLCRLPD